ncbi:MAG: adenylate kinase [Bacteroidetes bacterium]|nr:adenylate kinase [Bacteroidota bacterium]
MLNLVLFGPPGAGKGTQSENLISKYGLVHLSTGDILRTEIAQGTALGRKAKEVMDRGELVSDDIVIGMIESKLDQNPHAKGFIFDGFPRTTAQAIALDDLLQRKGTGISAMLALEVDDEELTRRLLKRGLGSGRADDANEEVIRRRIQEYNTKTLPLKNYYSEQGKFHSIEGTGSIEQIFKSLTERIIFLNAEMDLTALESDIEHLDLTIQDFEVADDIAPELLLEIDAIKRAEAEEAEEEKEAKKQAGRDKRAVNAKQKISDAKKTSSSLKKAAKSKPVAKQKQKTIKKVAPKKAPVKKVAKKVVKKAVKKSPPKKAVKKAIAKKTVKKAVKKAPLKKTIKKVIKKIVKKFTPKKAANKSPVKKTNKKKK